MRKPLILLALTLTAFIISVEILIVNVALPALMQELGASAAELQWVVDAYSLAFAALVLAGGSFGDRQGRKGVLLIGLAIFGGSCLWAALIDTPGQLIAARAVMGLGAALMFPATLSILVTVFTERAERAGAIGLWGTVTGFGVATGPCTRCSTVRCSPILASARRAVRSRSRSSPCRVSSSSSRSTCSW